MDSPNGSDEGRAAARLIAHVGCIDGGCPLCRQIRERLAECDRRSRAVEALIKQWRETDTDGHAHDPAVAFAEGVRQCADELEAALASPAPAAEDGR
jgi:hypothetical protein